jgi:protein gp37
MNRSKIDWPYQPLYLWNPITGCERGCPWCVVKNRVWPRIKHCYGGHDFNKVTFHPEQLSKPYEIKKPAFFFSDFYSDIEYWTVKMMNVIFVVINDCKHHTFMFLSKNPIAYYGYDWPENTMQGLTLTCTQIPHCQAEAIEEISKYPHPFLSLEPLHGTFFETDLSKIERVIVGAQTGVGAKAPCSSWIDSVKNNVPKEKIYWKSNIRKYL